MENKNTIHVNLYGGPGTGKSTMASYLFAKLKSKGINCELINEYAKQVVWEESFNKLNNQIYIFAKQLNKHIIIENKVDIVITDSPIMLGTIYDDCKTPYLADLIYNQYLSFNNLDIFLIREKEYLKVGRTQTEDEARTIDIGIKNMLNTFNIQYTTFPGNLNDDNIENIMELINEKIKETKNRNEFNNRTN